MKDGSIIFASSKSFNIEDSECEGLKRRLVNVPTKALNNNDHIVDDIFMKLALSEGKKVVTIKRVK